MKKYKFILMMIALVLPSLISIDFAYAAANDSTITYERINGVYFYQKDNITGEKSTNHVTKFYLNGKLAYCIEPLTPINDRVYNSTTNWSATGFTVEQRRFIELVGYFGQEYPGHNNDRYWLAAQELIWEYVRNVDVKYTIENDGGAEINIEKEKNDILTLVRNFEVVPNFGTDTIEGNMGDEIVLEDKNNVLSQYDIVYNGKHKVKKENNKLIITLSESDIGEESIRFIRSCYDDETSVIYYQGSSQKLASLRVSDPTSKNIKLISNGGSIEIDKIGEQLKLEDASYEYETIKLPNVVFALYANEDIKDSSGNLIYKKYQLINTLTTDENGIAILEDLYYGKYFLIEGESSLGNMINEERYYFEITKEDLVDGKIIEKINFANYLPKGIIEFTKTDVITGEVIPNTIIQIFTEDDRLVFTGKTDNNGKIVINSLFVGKFYIIEKNSASGYQLNNEKIYFEIMDNNEIIKINMTNERVTVPDTLKNQWSIKLIFGTVISIIGIMVFIYAVKKNKK